MVKRVVDDIDKIVRAVRFDGWQDTHAGEREVKMALRKTLFNYRLPTRSPPRVRKLFQLIGPISDEAKPSGKRSAGKPHAAFDVAGAGNGITVGAH